MDYTQIFNQFAGTDIAISILIGLLIFFWIWSILWVTKDISLRSENLFVQIISIIIITVLTPILGFPLYFLIRPVQYKFDKNWWREALLSTTIECMDCWKINPITNNNCTNCGWNLKITCKECKTKYSYEFWYCPNCWAPNIE